MAKTENYNYVIKAHDKASKKFGKIGRSAGGLQKSFQKLAVSAAAVFSGKLLIDGFTNVANTAGKAAEVNSKFKAVFKDQAAAADAYSASLAKSTGRSRYEIKSYLATLQDTFVPLGFARDEARGMSQSLSQLAIDLASFNNTSDADAIRDLQSAIVGNHETMRKYGVIITQAVLDQELANMGFSKGARNASEQMKAQARLNVIMKGTSDAQGDAVRTSGSYINSQKALASSFKDVKVAIGTAFLPGLASATQAMSQWLSDQQAAITNWAGGFTEGLRVGWAAAKVFVENFGQAMELFKIRAKLAFIGFVEDIKHAFTVAAPAYLDWFKDNWKNIFETMWNGLKSFTVNIGKNLWNLFKAIKDFATGKGWNFEWTGLLEGFENTVQKLPQIAERKLTATEKQLKGQSDDIVVDLSQKLLDKLNTEKVDPLAGLTGGAKTTGTTEAEKKATTQSKAGSFAARELRFATLGVGSKTKSGTEKNTEVIAKHNGRMVKLTEKMVRILTQRGRIDSGGDMLEIV